MSRIGKKPVDIPAGVTVAVDGNMITVKGSKGELKRTVDSLISVEVDGTKVKLTRSGESKNEKSLHGLYRALINNMVIGVSTGFKKDLELVGVGYKAVATNNLLELNLGYSHNIYLQIPTEIKVEAKTEKGKNPIVSLEGCDNELLGEVTAKIRSLRKIEPYKGKGIRFVGEQIRRKAGKTAAK